MIFLNSSDSQAIFNPSGVLYSNPPALTQKGSAMPNPLTILRPILNVVVGAPQYITRPIPLLAFIGATSTAMFTAMFIVTNADPIVRLPIIFGAIFFAVM